jgi:prepilin-type N-terminal cleavage/methylation domain-containing protein
MKFLKRMRAFTLVELLVVMAIIATLAGLAFPAIGSAITQSQLTTVLANAKQVYIAAQRASLDGASTGDTTLGWPLDVASADTKAYLTMLAANDYLPNTSFSKILGAPGVTSITTGTNDVSKDNIAFKIAKISDTNESSTIFLVTKNFSAAGTALAGSPFADKGFVTFKKGGDGGIYKKNQISQTNLYGAVPTEYLQ